MADIRDTVALDLEQAFVGDKALTAPSSLTISLHTGAPGYSGAPANEVVGGSYARQTITFGAPVDIGLVHRMQNDIEIEFTNMPAVTVTHWLVWDQANNAMFFGEVTPNVTVEAGHTFLFAIGDVTFQTDQDSQFSSYSHQLINNYLRGNSNIDFTADTVQVTLCTAQPGDGAVQNEAIGIVRQNVKGVYVDTGAGGYKNNTIITFPAISEQTVGWYAIVNTSQGNQVLIRTNFTAQTGTHFRFRPNSPSHNVV